VGARIPDAFRAKGTSLENRLELEIGQLEGLGRFTPEEAKRYKAMIPDLTGTHVTDQDMAKIQNLQREIDQQRTSTMGALGAKVPKSMGTETSNTIERFDPKTKRTVIYDAQTKKPLRFK
jgi:hypothetical protein